MTGLLRVLTIVVIVTTVACGRTNPSVGGASPEPPQTVMIEVVNQNFYDVNVLAAYEGDVQRRLGFVQGFQTDTFTLPWRSQQLVMISEFVGGGGIVSNVLDVNRGDFLELVILPDAHRRR